MCASSSASRRPTLPPPPLAAGTASRARGASGHSAFRRRRWCGRSSARGCALVFAVQAPGAAAPPATPALPSPLDGGDDATRSRGTSCSRPPPAPSLSASDAAAAAAAAAASIASIADELDRGPSAEVAAAGGGARGGGLLGGMSVAGSTTVWRLHQLVRAANCGASAGFRATAARVERLRRAGGDLAAHAAVGGADGAGG